MVAMMLTTTTMRMMVMMSQGYVKYSAESKPARTKKTHSYFPVIPAHNIHHHIKAMRTMMMRMIYIL